MKRFFLFLFSLSICFTSFTQTITSADIYLGLRKLNVLGSVLYIAAHPDDENTRLITYFSKDRLYRTGYLSMTRGDGGQNLIGDEQGIALGLIRTQELLSARRIDGGEQFFTRAYDFGFSKNPEETFTKWDKEKILSDVVWVIRKFQPDVIITRFPTTGEGGHAHHTASAILANEAFTAAADPKRFPEQLKYVQPWQAKRIVWNTFNFGGNNTQRADQFTFDMGGFNAVLGKSYGEIAAESRSQHKSQGFGVPASRGEAMEFFSTTGGSKPVKDLFDDVELTWKRVKGGERIMQSVQKAIDDYDFLKPQRSVSQLTTIYNELMELPAGYWREKKLEEVTRLIAWCSGMWMEATTNVQNAVQGDSLRINFNLNNRNGGDVKLQKISVGYFDTSLNIPLEGNKNFNLNKTILVPANKQLSQPYWLETKMQEGMFTVNDQTLIGQPDIIPPYVVRFTFQVNGIDLSFYKAVQYKFTHPVKGEIYQPLFVIPPVNIASTPDLMIVKKGENVTRNIEVELFANRKLETSSIDVALHSENIHLIKKDTAAGFEKNTKRNYTFGISTDKLVKESELLKGSADYTSAKEKGTATASLTGIHYDHIPEIRYFFSDNVHILNIDLKTMGKKIGYIIGAGDKVPEALEQMGYEVTLLTDKELTRNNLSQFNTIITGIRAYNTNEWMNKHYDNLMKYVADGGNLIVQYNTSNNIGPVRAKIGPYDFTISRNRVTDENAPVSFLKPEHVVLNFPNKITQDDFKGWIQERSIYDATAPDKNFETILTMNDPSEQADNGSLIVAKYGKGYFTYTGLVFFRELPAGVPGAYRLLANLIALNYKKTF
jgi:LmbE family N-acetylglucosaminyl deacetylase